MDIIKRNGSTELYDKDKIVQAVRKCFKSTGNTYPEESVEGLAHEMELFVKADAAHRNVESIQDEVERQLMLRGHFNEAKSYILYRKQRTENREILHKIADLAKDPALFDRLRAMQTDFTPEEADFKLLYEKFKALSKDNMNSNECLNSLIKAAVELTSPDRPLWEKVAARLLDFKLNKLISKLTPELGIYSLYDKIKYLTAEGLYGEYILQHYSQAEIDEAESFIVPERNLLFTYSGLDLLSKRYMIRLTDHRLIESAQEMFIGIALHLAMNESAGRMDWVRRFYDMLSTLQVTMATPTLSNARKPFHQLSSCFIDTVPDSLEGIYRSIDNFAQVSKYGGGMGLYFGKVRAVGGAIRGYKGVAGGIVRWLKLVNDTAVAVDQLGMRQGAVAVYLDVWHKDLPEFLQIRTNNGDDRMKAHDIFPAVCYPDLFWKMAEEDLNQTWHLFCPNEILTVKGYSLEDYYGEEWEKRYQDCIADPRLSRRTLTLKEIVRLILRSATETGTPFAFNRDTVNRANPNAHKGMIYCSNLCTEIAQNMSAISSESVEVLTQDQDKVVVTRTRPGDFVVCNLASLCLANLPLDDEESLRNTIYSVVRTLDNVIDLNYYPLPYAQITNQRYRSIGLGISGYDHALALKQIKWESEEHLEFVDRVFERINFMAIEASMKLAQEKGHYEYFEGSDWDNGDYFSKRGYTSPEWKRLREEVHTHGLRNAYLLAIAPTSSTGIIAGTSAGIDPVMKRFFIEEKKGNMLPRVAPALSDKTWWHYKGAYHMDQRWSVRAAGIRQRHIDQAQSMNLYITTDYTLRQVLNLYIQAWREGVKTIYYVRSQSLEVEECESCAS